MQVHDIDRAIRESPHFTPGNVAIAALITILVVVLIGIGVHTHHRATVCDRAATDGSPWARGPEAQAGRQACSRFLEAEMIPCTIASHNQTAFCVQSPHDRDGNYPDDAKTIFAYRPERGEHGELLLIGEFLHDDVVFY